MEHNVAPYCYVFFYRSIFLKKRLVFAVPTAWSLLTLGHKYHSSKRSDLICSRFFCAWSSGRNYESLLECFKPHSLQQWAEFILSHINPLFEIQEEMKFATKFKQFRSYISNSFEVNKSILQLLRSLWRARAAYGYRFGDVIGRSTIRHYSNGAGWKANW